MRAAIARLGPFFHNIALPHGLSTWDPKTAQRPEERVRVEDLKTRVWPLVHEVFGSFEGLRVLDVASNSGGFSVEAARSGAAEVIGIDIVDHYLEQARFVRSALGLDQVEFRKQRIEDLTPEADGTFDLVFCFDVLYHLDSPLLALRRLAAVTRRMLVVETRVLDRPEWENHPLWLQQRLPPFEENSTQMATGRWRSGEVCQLLPTARAVKLALDFVGFDRVANVGAHRHYPAYRQRQTLFTAVRG